MKIGIRQTLSLVLILTAGSAFGDGGGRDDVRQAAGHLEAKTTDVRLFVRENAGNRGADLETFREEMLEESIPALQREIDRLQETVLALNDAPESPLGEGVEIIVESCWNKWKRIFAADKYVFRAVITVDPEIKISEMAIRDPKNQDMDPVTIPKATHRSDDRPGEEYAIHDSFKTWDSKAEFVVEDQNGQEHTREFNCSDE